MPLVLDDFHKTVKEVEDAQRQHDKDQGALAEMMKRLKKEFGCKTYKEGQRKYREWMEEIQGIFARYNRQFTAFKKKYRKVLGAPK